MQFKSDIPDNRITLSLKEPSTFEFILPGIVQSINIGGEIIFDSELSSNKESYKIAYGYKEKTIQISLLLLSNKYFTSYQLLDQLEKLFKNTKNQDQSKDNKTPMLNLLNSTVPLSYIVTNKHINRRGINKIYFLSLNSSEDNNKNYISVTLNFIEVTFPKYTKESLGE